MVRVISVHHFVSQNVQIVEQPTACTTAPPNRLLLALMSNCIEVRDLTSDSKVLFSFPTVDEVSEIVHCLNGDYVATLESKYNRQNKEINFVRVYINWDSVATLQQSKMTSSGISLGASECGMVQPMRARIAGRVTPTTNQTELGSLEMIEIPVKKNPDKIACCQVTGNLLILSKSTLNIYAFKVKMHDISKIKFIDFEEVALLLELPFIPSTIDICENYMAAMNQECMYLFKVCKKASKESSYNLKRTNSTDILTKTDLDGNECIDFEQLLKEEKRSNSKDKITVHLPSIVRGNSAIHKHSPFTFRDKEMEATISTNSTLENKLCTYRIYNLIQLRLVPILVENASRQITEQFKKFILKPVYIDENLNKGINCDVDNILRSDYSKCLNSVSCLVATQQEAYLFHFNESENAAPVDDCIAVYPFTAPVFEIVMEDYLLHALTETGLESYTLRTGHELCHSFGNLDNVNLTCPPIDDSICLVGLRPFLGVENIFLASNYLLLLANADSSPTHSVTSNSSSNINYWTLYSLELPTPKTIFNDIEIVANSHRFSSAQTYCHLINEAHMVLRVVLLYLKWTMTEDSVKLIARKEENVDDVIETFRNSCSLLGDHYIMCSNKDDYMLAIPYYKMARITAINVIRRVKKLQDQVKNQHSNGLVHYLKYLMIDIKNVKEIDKLFASNTKQNFLDELLKVLKIHDYEDLPTMIIKNKILQECSTDKLINILTQNSANFSEQSKKHLALCLLYIQKCNYNQAKNSLESISEDNLYNLLYENWEILFEINHQCSKDKGITSFSEFSDLMISQHVNLYSSLLVDLIFKKKVLHLSRLIKAFLEYLPSNIGSEQYTATLFMQKTLEKYFHKYFSNNENINSAKVLNEKGFNDALKLIVRSYLSQLQMFQMKEDSIQVSQNKEEIGEKEISKNLKNNDEAVEDFEKDKDTSLRNDEKECYLEDRRSSETVQSYILSKYRYNYLDKMPPFQMEITSKMYETYVDNYKTRQSANSSCPESDVTLAKLQAILCSPVITKNITSEVNTFLSLNSKLRGQESLQSILMSNNDAVLLLLDVCPQCLLQFGKDRFNRTDEWKFLIASIQRKILKLSQLDNLHHVCFFHKKILKDVLSHVAQSMNLDELTQVFPQRISTSNVLIENKEKHESHNDQSFDPMKPLDNSALTYTDRDLDILNEIQNYEPYVLICKETMHANQINKLIKTSGQQLLCTLSL